MANKQEVTDEAVRVRFDLSGQLFNDPITKKSLDDERNSISITKDDNGDSFLNIKLRISTTEAISREGTDLIAIDAENRRDVPIDANLLINSDTTTSIEIRKISVGETRGTASVLRVEAEVIGKVPHTGFDPFRYQSSKDQSNVLVDSL